MINGYPNLLTYLYSQFQIIKLILGHSRITLDILTSSIFRIFSNKNFLRYGNVLSMALVIKDLFRKFTINFAWFFISDIYSAILSSSPPHLTGAKFFIRHILFIDPLYPSFFNNFLLLNRSVFSFTEGMS